MAWQGMLCTHVSMEHLVWLLVSFSVWGSPPSIPPITGPGPRCGGIKIGQRILHGHPKGTPSGNVIRALLPLGRVIVEQAAEHGI